MWCIGRLTEEYRLRMYGLLELYARPYLEREPVVCIDEKSKQLLKDMRTPLSLKPGVLAEMCEAVWRGDLKSAAELHHRLHEINKAVFFDTNPIPMKYMAKKLGLVPSNEHRLPMVPATPELEKRLDAVLARAKF